MPIGVLALQGDFREHINTLASLGVDSIEVRTISDLEQANGLIIPGGESTAIQKLATNFGLLEPIRSAIREGLPTFGTCAGLIMLADEILDGIAGQVGFGGLDVSVRRNAFGNQVESFETQLSFEGISGSKIEAAFIRAPIVERIGPNVEVLSELADGRIVAVRNSTILGIAFHPEISGEKRVHEYFIGMVG
jgi:5'-phosphate synthase pdxT subunit